MTSINDFVAGSEHIQRKLLLGCQRLTTSNLSLSNYVHMKGTETCLSKIKFRRTGVYFALNLSILRKK